MPASGGATPIERLGGHSNDPIVPDPANPQSLNRYAYCLNNPTRYVDPDGHFAVIPVLIVVGIVALKAVDYGWTAYDIYQSGRVLGDPSVSRGDKLMAGLNIALAAAFELGEPDDESPVGLPLDDVGRRAVMAGARETLEEGGEEALERFVRDTLGDQADDVFDIADGYIRAVPEDWVGQSRAFKTYPGEDGLSVFEGVSPDDVLAELPGNRVPNTTVTIPRNGLPPGTKVVPTDAPGLSQRLSEAHRILVRPEGWSVDRFAKVLKALVGWE